jgi:CheY-like chemotaxis protein
MYLQGLRCDISIVALTGWGQERDKQRAFDAGFHAHLTRRADPQQLSKTILTLRGKQTAF